MDLLREGLVLKMDIQAGSYTESIVLDSEDIPGELDKLVASNSPGVFRGASHRLGIAKGSDSVLDPLSLIEVPIAVTPAGNADSPVNNQFAKPFVIQKTVSWLLDKLNGQTAGSDRHYYMQSQDDNLSGLCQIKDFPIPQYLPRPVLGKLLGSQIASNLWIGAAGTTSRLHSDNYDNVYVQVAGSKRIWLIPPGDVYALDEQFLEPATYNEHMELKPDEPSGPKVLFPTVNPSDPSSHNEIYTQHASPRFVDVVAGDVLFIPALWYHQVEILPEETHTSVNISANYWHEPFAGDVRWAEYDFVRRSALIVRGYTDETYFSM